MLKNKKIKYVFPIILVISFFLGLASLLSVNSVNAVSLYGVTLSGNNLSGYAWSENVGWISFSGPGYGVVSSGGNLSGYAWNDQLGWLSFNAADLAGCPSGVCLASVSTNADGSLNSIDGWAKFTSLTVASGNSGGCSF